MKIVAFLPVKGNSTRIESKNMKLLDGKPLFIHTLEKLLDCDFIDEVYLDSESDKIFDIASEMDCKKLYREEKFANNQTDGNILFCNEVSKVEADIYIQILCTSPFIKKSTIKKGIDILINNDDYDSVVLVRNAKLYLWGDSGPKYDINAIPNSNELEDTIIETMGLYITKKEVPIFLNRRIGNNPYLLVADEIEAVDINYPSDFEYAHKIMAGIRDEENKYFNFISRFLSSAIFSDVLDELGLDGFIPGLKSNRTNAKIMGRAKTLKIRKLKDGEDPNGIYDALDSYETVVPNDIIVVENECSDFAYFGGLNTALALKKGAQATIIAGKTRDLEEINRLNYTVFSEGYSAKDVKGRATLESINKKITIKGITIKPGDIIFGDNEGIIVIPQNKENIIIKDALNKAITESNILSQIVDNKTIDDIVSKNGYF